MVRGSWYRPEHWIPSSLNPKTFESEEHGGGSNDGAGHCGGRLG